MADERLRIKIEADAKRAERDLKNLAELSEELTDDDLTIVVQAKTQAAEANLKNLVRQLGLAEDPADIKVLTTGIKQARDELEQLARAAKDLPTVDLDTTGARKNIDDLGKSADSSKSVLANMVGNASQDLGALGGLAGSAGVAIGQMGEYMADAAGQGDKFGTIVKNFATVAGPIALISVGVGLASSALANMRKKSEEARKALEATSEALGDAVGTNEAAAESIEGVSGALGLLGEALNEADPSNVDKMTAAMGALGLQARDAVGLIQTLESGLAGGPTIEALLGPGVPPEYMDSIVRAIQVEENWADARSQLVQSGVPEKVIDQIEAEGSALQDLIQIGKTQDVEGDIRRELGKAKALGGTRRAAILAAEAEAKRLGREGDALLIFDLYIKGLQNQASETAKAKAAQELWRAEQDRSNEAFAQGLEGARLYGEALAGIDYGQAALEGATTAMSAFSEERVAAGNLVQDEAEAWRDFSEAVKDGGLNLDTTTEKGAKQQDALEDLAGVIDTQLAQAYQDAAGDGAKFKTSAENIANTLRDRLTKELGLSGDEADDVIYTLGLMPEDIETRYALSGTEEAKIKLDLLSGSIDDLPKDVKATVTQQIIAGDYVGALDTVQGYYDRNPARLGVKLYLAPGTNKALERGLALGPIVSSAPLPPDQGPTPVGLGATTLATVPAAGGMSSPTVSVGVSLNSRGLRDLTAAVRNAVDRGLGGRTAQATAQRYVWRNGRYLEVG
jgi:hypothetical protein